MTPLRSNGSTRSPLAVVLSSDAVGLGAVRSLRHGGVPTAVVMMDPWEPVRASRYGRKFLVPKTSDPDAAILDVLTRVDDGQRPVLIPTSDHLTYFVSKHRSHGVVVDRFDIFDCWLLGASDIAERHRACNSVTTRQTDHGCHFIFRGDRTGGS